ncbi:Protein bric-a-brac 1 [Armadillidium nasatum]|uniref:Protein bric-a-brac 1 n=1 Tax=Armadillidium nasatum TaxID=96803 RepID=A0A5N5T2P1_9CRUS|nr:Protein bric-a-brac 1 [Armadillidium nasatum]
MSSSPTNNRDQQFCLRWNNYQSNLTQVFHQLFQSETFVDVTLACEGRSVKAHRLVLSACSPYFLTVLTETPCSHPVIILQGVKWVELKAVVEFMYKGEINICQEQLASLLRVAENLKIRGLADVGGEEAEAVLTSPSESPRASQFWAEDTPRKRRRLSDEPRSRSRSRSPTPGPHTPTPHTPASITEPMDPIIDLPGGNISRGSSSASNPPPSLPSPSPVASLASSLSSLAHLHGPMPPPGPPLPPHLAHLPPLSPLSPLLNMHPMSRHHSPEDFEIRPGIAEMIREEDIFFYHFNELLANINYICFKWKLFIFILFFLNLLHTSINGKISIREKKYCHYC